MFVRRLIVTSSVALAVLVVGALTVAVASSTRARNPSTFAYQYSVPFICGWLPPVPPQDDQYAKPGDYATSINVHNPSLANQGGEYRVSLYRRVGAPAPPALVGQVLPVRNRTVETIDCVAIWASAGVPPGTFIEGAVHIGLPVVLPVSAVYTSQTHNDPAFAPDAGAGMSIDVEQFAPFSVPAPG